MTEPASSPGRAEKAHPPRGGTVRVALTETRNVYPMPASTDGLKDLAGRLDEIRRANLDHHEGLIARAARRGARIIGLGELFAFPYFALDRHAFWLAAAEDASGGPTSRAMAAAAREHGIVVIAPFYERDPADGRRYNAALVIDADGRLLGAYRKAHIPAGTNDVATFHETFYYERSRGGLAGAPGNVSGHDVFPVFRTSVADIGISICYDRHFEGVVRTLADGGARIVFSPAVTFGAKSRRLWRAELAVDAMRHRVYVAASNRRGAEAPWGVEFFGDSHVVGPDGDVPDLSDDGELVLAEVDLDALTAPDPAGWSLRQDRRPETDSGP